MSARSHLFRVYWAIRRVIAPQLKYSQYIYEDILKRYVNPSVEWIDLGCGHSILPTWRHLDEKQLIDNCKSITGMDYDLGSLRAHSSIVKRLRGDISRLPFKQESFDLVTANMVVEHLDKPVVQFREIHRILRPKGMFLFHTPNVYGYGVIVSRLVPEAIKGKLIRVIEGREEHDVFETHYAANSEASIRLLAQETGFEVVEMQHIVTDAIFSMVPPLALLELLWIRLLMADTFRSLRTNLIVVLRKV